MRRIEKKHPLAIRWFHWLNFPLLAVMIWSGLLIYWANDVYGVPIPVAGRLKLLPDHAFGHNGQGGTNLYAPDAPDWYRKALPNLVSDDGGRPVIYNLEGRLAEGMGWHFLFMWLFTINGALYVLVTSLTGQWRYLVPRKGSLRHALATVAYDFHLTRKRPPPQKYNGAQQIAYTAIIVMGIGSVLTGIAIYKPVQAGWLTALFGGYGAARFIHFWLMMGYVLFFLIHVGQVVRTGWNNFRGMATGYEISEEVVG